MKRLKSPDLPAKLLHYTNGEALKSILNGENGMKISLRASRVDHFWRKDTSDADADSSSDTITPSSDDPEEFVGFVNILKVTDYVTRCNSEKNSSTNETDSSKEEKIVFGSTYTPYILCFAKGEDVSQEIFERLKKDDSSCKIQMALIFDTELLDQIEVVPANNQKKIRQNVGTDRLEIFPIEYVKDTDTAPKQPDGNDANDKLHHFKENFQEIFIENGGMPIEEDDVDLLLDSCFYLKRKQYDVEKEIRVIYREQKDFKFHVEGKTYHSEFNDEDKYRYILFPIHALSKIVFAKGVAPHDVKEYVEGIVDEIKKSGNVHKEKLLRYVCSHILFTTYDGQSLIKKKNNII